MSSRFDNIARYFETLTAESVAQLHEHYTRDCTFKDPFNEVRGVAHTQRIFAHMFITTVNPRFIITARIEQGDEAFFVWDFRFTAKRLLKGEQCIRGCSHLRLAGDGRVQWHRDYWDAAEELYEKLPVIGVLMRAIKKQNTVY
jgi:ketosteroid isomerase-like protein